MTRNVLVLGNATLTYKFNENTDAKLLLENIDNSYLLHDENSARLDRRLHLNNTCILKLKKERRKNINTCTAIFHKGRLS